MCVAVQTDSGGGVVPVNRSGIRAGPVPSRVPRTGDVIQILGPLVGTWIQQVGDLGKVRWKFRTGI